VSWRQRLTIGAAFIAVVGSLAADCNPPSQPSPTYSIDIALRHAPIIFQDADLDYAKADYITAFDYDENRIADDNWNHLRTYQNQLLATIYYSVVESDRYWFIVYAFFHPRDWTNFRDQEHENDMEGILAIVLKDGTEFGRLIGIITVFHTNFYSYTPAGSPLVEGHEDIDGTLSTMSWNGTEHAKVSIESHGHGVKAWPVAGDFTGEPGGGDGIIYRPGRSPSDSQRLPSSGDDRTVDYKLVNLFNDPWVQQLTEARRDRDNSAAFATWGTLKGNDDDGCSPCGIDKAQLPWDWDDTGFPGGEDGLPAGLLALDPAFILNDYFNGTVTQNTYSDNWYLASLVDWGFGPDDVPRDWPEGLDIGDLLAKAPPDQTT
jgi:hypothetical protein